MTIYKMGELFCGPGGLAWVATHANIADPNYRIVHAWANDYDQDTCNTYIRNIAGADESNVICGDVRKLDLTQFSEIDGFSLWFSVQ